MKPLDTLGGLKLTGEQALCLAIAAMVLEALILTIGTGSAAREYKL